MTGSSDAPSIKRKSAIFAVTVLVIGLLTFSLLKMTKPDRPATETKERVWQVSVIEAQPQRLSPQLTLYGKVESPDIFKAAAPSQSRVAAVLIQEGQRVQTGDLLVVLSEADFKPQVTQAQAEVTEFESQIKSEQLRYESDQNVLQQQKQLLELSEAELKRNTNLEKRKLSSESALDVARQSVAQQRLSLTQRELNVADHDSRLARLQASLDRAQARLQEAQRDLGRSRMSAPFDGIISKLSVTEGNQVKANDIVLEMYALEGLEVRARIPNPYQQEIMSTLNGKNTLAAQSQVASFRLQRLAGTANSSGIDALFSISDGSENLRLGQQLTLTLSRTEQNDLVKLPYEALFGNDRVFTVDENERLQAVNVHQAGNYFQDGKDYLLVTSTDLHSGDRIVTTHLPNAVQGLKVSIVE